MQQVKLFADLPLSICMQFLHPNTVFLAALLQVITIFVYHQRWQHARCCVAAYIQRERQRDRQTDNRPCVVHGCFKAPVFRIRKNVIKQRCQDLCVTDWGDDRKHELHSKCPNTENKIPLLTKVQNSGEKNSLFLDTDTRICLVLMQYTRSSLFAKVRLQDLPRKATRHEKYV
jgi:hypothetical protein